MQLAHYRVYSNDDMMIHSGAGDKALVRMVLPAAATWPRRPAFRQLLLIACCAVMAACSVAATSSQGGSVAAVQEHQLSALQRSMLAVRPLCMLARAGVIVADTQIDRFTLPCICSVHCGHTRVCV